MLHMEGNMGRKSLTFVFWIFLAIGTVLAITTWAASPKTSERLGRDSQGNDLPAESLESVLKTGGTAPDLLSVGRCRVSAGVSIRAFAGNYSTNDEGFDGGSAFISACEPSTSIRALC